MGSSLSSPPISFIILSPYASNQDHLITSYKIKQIFLPYILDQLNYTYSKLSNYNLSYSVQRCLPACIHDSSGNGVENYFIIHVTFYYCSCIQVLVVIPFLFPSLYSPLSSSLPLNNGRDEVLISFQQKHQIFHEIATIKEEKRRY